MIILYDEVGKKTPETVGLADALTKQTGELVPSRCLADLDIAIEAGKPVSITLDGRDIASFGQVCFRTIARSRDIASIVGDYLADHGVHFVDSEVSHATAQSKLHQMYLLNKAQLPVPNTYYGSPAFIKDQTTFPFIYKAVTASKGDDNYFIESHENFDAVEHRGKRFIAQNYIKNEGDYRFLIFGDEIALVIARKGVHGSHLNNTSQGAQATLVPVETIEASVKTLAIAAAKLLRREVAGVDIMFGADGKPYILEVNRTPQLATGAFVEQKIEQFARYMQGL